jgi:predicted alpha-1,2-mannosidase
MKNKKWKAIRIHSVWPFFLLLFGFLACQQDGGPAKGTKDQPTPVDYVNPYIGNISHLLVPTYPTVHLPNSMLRVIPQRGSYADLRLKGLPVVTTSHRGRSAFAISPVQGKSDGLQPVYAFSYDQESITPYRYDVYLDEEKVAVSFGVSHQAGLYQMEYRGEGDPYLILYNAFGELRLDGQGISGYQWLTRDTFPHAPRVYLYLETDREAIEFGLLDNGQISRETEARGRNLAAVLRLNDDGRSLKLRYGISFISVEQARKNLYREIDGFDLAKVIQKGRDAWQEALAKTQVEGGSENDKTLFYTSVYRTYERPVCISEDGRYYSAFDGQVHPDNGQPFYTDDWIWDTYRATHPLRVLTEKEMELNILRSFIRMAEQMDEFWMPTFPEVTGDSRRMNSNHGVATVLDAYVKGLTDFDIEKAYEACKAAITEKTLAPWSDKKAGALDAFYKENGYIPAITEKEKEIIPEVHPWEKRQAVAVTLGTVYDEWCLAQIAKILGKQDDYHYFLNRSYNYRKLFNPETGFFHPKDKAGEFIEPFDYRFSGGRGARLYYGENNGWIYRWDVPHNVADLIGLMGGQAAFLQNLDATFTEPLGQGRYQFYRQMPDHTGNVGQFSMANEPSLHIPYLYNYAGQPWKTQKRIKQLIPMWFRNDLMGVPGDEDGGGMSGFVAFSMLGFYPVTPGSPTYNIGSPFFEKAVIDLGNGKTFTIVARNLNERNKYIQRAELNGEEWHRPWFAHEEIKNGGVLVLEMGAYAHETWGSAPEMAPPSAEKQVD